jgi:hypothetical protein
MRRSLALVIGATLVTVLGLAASASAHFNTGLYTHNGCPGTNTNRVDPINFVFDIWGTWDRAMSQMRTHSGWYDQGGSTQTFVDHGNCYQMISQAASAGVSSSRFHIRLHPIHHDDYVGWTSVGDAHHEDFVWYCPGHAVDSNGSNGSGFDQGRRQLRTAFSNAGHSWTSVWWGNTQNFRQCDGDYAGSDGYTVWVDLHQFNH